MVQTEENRTVILQSTFLTILKAIRQRTKAKCSPPSLPPAPRLTLC